MITFKQFLSEIQTASSDGEQAAKLVFENCKPFLKESEFHFTKPDINYGVGALYRGMNDVKLHRLTEVSGTRLRSPKDSSKEMHELLDDYFDYKFGYRYRSRGVFCSGKESIAESYGQACLIFPIGNFKYAFSKQIEDAYVDLDPKGGWGAKRTILDSFKNDLYKEFIANFEGGADLGPHEINAQYEKFLGEKFGRYGSEAKQEWWHILSEWLDKESPYQDTGLRGMLHGMGIGQNEIMLQCEKYYLVPIASSGFSNEFAMHLIDLMDNK
jgi:hypothetical protein